MTYKILIVDPFAAPRYLSSSFRELDAKVTAIYTLDYASISDYSKPDPDDFDQQIFAGTDDVRGMIEALGDKKFDYILNGSDGSVAVTDRLAEALNITLRNSSETSIYRENKYWMHKRLEQAKLNHIKQIIFDYTDNDISDLLSSLEFPCFIKPLSGAASIGARKIATASEMRQYFSELDMAEFRKKIASFAKDENAAKFLIGEYVNGDEYVIDTFSHAGIHHLSSVQRYSKKEINKAPMYRAIEVVPESDPHWIHIVEYTRQCLGAIGLDNGFAHSEVIWTDAGPVLVEVNPRVSGLKGAYNQLAKLNGLLTQPALLINSCVETLGHLRSDPVARQSRYYRILQLFHFSDQPLPDLEDALAAYSIFMKMLVFREIGFIHPRPPDSLVDLVALVICESNSIAELDVQCDSILQKDETGW
jgi:biotin carboxylase